MKTTRRVQDATHSGTDTPGRDYFTPDFADMLVAECLMANRGIVVGAWFRLQMWNCSRAYRVVVTTEVEETDLEFDKLTGESQLWRDGRGGYEWN